VNGLFYNFLQNGFMHVVSALFSGNSIGEMASRWKYPLPTPFSPCVRILTFERVRQGDPTQPARPVALVLLLYALEMLGEWFFDRRRQHRVPIFVAFAGTHNYLIGGEIDIFDPQLQTLHQSQALRRREALLLANRNDRGYQESTSLPVVSKPLVVCGVVSHE